LAGQLVVARTDFESTPDFYGKAGRNAAPYREAAAVAPLPRIAFLFNAQAHQILHGITTAEAFAMGWRANVDILSASATHLDLARALTLDESHCLLRFERIGSPLLHRTADLLRSAVPPKLLTLAAVRRQLNGYDAIALPERTSTIMRRFGVTRPRLIHVDHGAGDRAAGFDPRIARFDFALVAGQKQRRRMLAEGLIRPGAHAVVGYPKFEAIDRLRDPHWSPFADERPVVLYNPHFSAKLGSWPRDGVAIVDAIVRDGRFNLVVAPHIRLCDGARGRTAVAAALAPYAALPNVHVDLGSPRSIDMTYTTLADIYVGDVSSQIYEFLRRPKPALFVNSHDRAWQDDPDYAHWHFGPVVDGADALIDGLDQAIAGHDDFAPEQCRAFADTFDLREGESHSHRAAAAIADFLGATPR